MKTALALVLAAGLSGLVGCRSSGSGPTDGNEPVPATNAAAEKAAVEVAETWLKAVDGGQYAESWGQAAEYMRKAVTEDLWAKQMQAVRAPLGKLISREVASKQYATSLPGAPDGEYVVIQFKTSFENKESAVETVTPMRENDGTWRVSGYYIK
ncbi:MAG: DUF4019 domain-containing protein [Phycisphaerae bacterium]